MAININVDRTNNNGASGMFSRKTMTKAASKSGATNTAMTSPNKSTTASDLAASKKAAVMQGFKDKQNNSIIGKAANKLGEVIEKNSTTGYWKNTGKAMQGKSTTKKSGF